MPEETSAFMRLHPTNYMWHYLVFIFQQLQALDVSIVTSAGNKRQQGLYCDDGLPQRLLRTDLDTPISPAIENLMVVGATDEDGLLAYMSQLFRDPVLSQDIVHAPGRGVLVPHLEGGYYWVSGTSFSTPLVAALVAYLRGMESPWAATFKSAVDVTEVLVNGYLQRKLYINYVEGNNPYSFIWNGQIQGESCLKNGLIADANGNYLCPEELRDCSVLEDQRKRQSCMLPSPGNSGGGGSSGGDGGLRPSPITWQPGTPSPTCSSNCGSLCSGYYCKQNPTGNPPDYSDPKLHPVSTPTQPSTPSVPTSTPSVPTSTSKAPSTPSNPARVPSRSARWDMFNMAVTLDSGSQEHVWVGHEDDQSHSVESYLEDNSKCYNPDWQGADHTYPDYPSSMEVHNFFGASDCKFVFQVDSRNEWLGLDDGEWLGNVICSEYDYAECYKDTDKTFYACDDLNAYRTRWAYCTWDHWFTSSAANSRVATLSRLQAIRMLKAQNKTVRTGLEKDGSLSENFNGTRTNGTIKSTLD